MEWRRVIRSVDRWEKGSEEIDRLAKALSRKYGVGDPKPPAHIRRLYRDMTW